MNLLNKVNRCYGLQYMFVSELYLFEFEVYSGGRGNFNGTLVKVCNKVNRARPLSRSS